MSELLSVGVDVGTTTTQLIVSKLTVQNEASSFAVPRLQIVDRQVVYRSPVHFTPLLGTHLVDGEGVRQLLEKEYQQAGICPEMVDTGAVIITGETSRKENARAVLDAISGFAGDFVVATAGPALESVLAAKGAGAVELSKESDKPVLHMDIGGGTANLALLRDGKILATGCMNVGGRLIKLGNGGVITYVSPVLSGLTDLQPGDYPLPGQTEAIAQILTYGLEMAAGLRPPTKLLKTLWTKECGPVWKIPEETCLLSFSGGVADCIEEGQPNGAYGDIGTQLGSAIKKSRLCRGEYRLGSQTIRATVIGAGCYSAQLSGSTVFCSNVDLPLKNLPVIPFTRQEQDSDGLWQRIAQRLEGRDEEIVVLALPGYPSGGYGEISRLAAEILRGTKGKGVYLCLEADMAKALGQKLSLLLPAGTPCLCIDRVQPEAESYLDIGNPIGPALPVVMKTLVLQEKSQ